MFVVQIVEQSQSNTNNIKRKKVCGQCKTQAQIVQGVGRYCFEKSFSEIPNIFRT